MEKRILVVENDLAICQEIQEYMQNDLTKVHTIASGKDALANFIKCEYCLVVLDVQIPDIDIMEVLQMMRHLRHTPILLLTDPLYSGKIVNFFHAGADAYITKPLVWKSAQHKQMPSLIYMLIRMSSANNTAQLFMVRL